MEQKQSLKPQPWLKPRLSEEDKAIVFQPCRLRSPL